MKHELRGGGSISNSVDLARRSIAVTGATGFLGRYICRALLNRGARVVGAVRSLSRGGDLSHRGFEAQTADLLDVAAMRSAFEGVDAVVANAALVMGKQASEFVRVNVDGMTNLLQATVDAGVRRLVVVSTVSIYYHNGRSNREDSTQVSYTEEMLKRRPYAATKARAETLAWQAAEKAGLEVTAVRPGYAYGRGARIIDAFKLWFRGPVALIPYYRRIPLAYGGDIAEAIVRCLERPVSVGRAYNLAGREDRSWRDFAQAWAEAGGPMARVRLPVPWVARHCYDTALAEKDLQWFNTRFLEAITETLESARDLNVGPR